jgi:hypothetical protein
MGNALRSSHRFINNQPAIHTEEESSRDASAFTVRNQIRGKGKEPGVYNSGLA